MTVFVDTSAFTFDRHFAEQDAGASRRLTRYQPIASQVLGLWDFPIAPLRAMARVRWLVESESEEESVTGESPFNVRPAEPAR
jgi:hypothetical protein